MERETFTLIFDKWVIICLSFRRECTKHGLGKIFQHVALMDTPKDQRINFLIKTAS